MATPESSSDTLTAFYTSAEKLQQHLQAATTEADVNNFQPALDDLRRQLAEGVEWWVGYDTRQAREKLQQVEQAYDTATRRIRPARKFRFRRTVEQKRLTEANVVPERPETYPGIVYGVVDVQGGVLRCDDLSGRDVTIRGLRDVHVVIGDVGAVRFVELTGCTVSTGRVDGSVWVANCERCKVTTRARQLRVHDTVDTDFVVDVQSGPVIERCRKVRFGALGEGGMWNDVKDFSWLREDRSPNWEVIEEGEKEGSND